MVVKEQAGDESEASDYWVRDKSRLNEVCSPSWQSLYTPSCVPKMSHLSTSEASHRDEKA